jgi:uncharacterized protein (TIGR02118 family)
MVMERLKGSGMLRYEVDKGLAGGGPGAPAPFVAACHLYFNATADFQKGIAAHGTEIMGDIPNYTDISPQIQIIIVRSSVWTGLHRREACGLNARIDTDGVRWRLIRSMGQWSTNPKVAGSNPAGRSGRRVVPRRFQLTRRHRQV